MPSLSGKWTLKAVASEAGWQQRLVISGSRASDGAYVMAAGTTIEHVDGDAVSINGQALNPATNAWGDSLVNERMTWDNASGVQITLRFDDNPPGGDLDFNDLVVLCLPEDELHSSKLSGPRPDLTIPERYARQQLRPRQPNR